MFPNIIHLDFGGSMKSESVGKVLKLIAESYPNLEYLNISALRNIFRPKNDKGLTAIADILVSEIILVLRKYVIT